jgi:hypothetical protein
MRVFLNPAREAAEREIGFSEAMGPACGVTQLPKLQRTALGALTNIYMKTI